MQNVQSLSYEKIRQNLVDFIKSTDEFKDYNFQASGISTLLNLLSYNTHYLGYYVKMMLNETFVDSAKLRESMLSNAKLVGYIPRGLKSARAELWLKAEVNLDSEPDDYKILIPRGSKFKSSKTTNDERIFTVVDDFFLVYRTLNTDGDKMIYRNDPNSPLVVYEGSMETWNFEMDSGIAHQRFIIKERGIDFDSIRVKVYDTVGADTYQVFKLATTMEDIGPDSPVFYITTNEEGYYEIFFGNNVFGKQLTHGNMINVTYVVNNGELGNGAGEVGNWSPVITLPAGRVLSMDVSTEHPQPVSSGGMNEETVEDMRFTIPNHYRRQNRIVTVDDYKSILISEYRNIESLNVWGGEDGYRKEYGKVFVCIKPKYADKLSPSAKDDIKKSLLKKRGVVGIDPVFVDPEVIFLDIEATAIYDGSKTDMGRGEIERQVSDNIIEYAKIYLNKFSSMYSEVDVLDYVRSKNLAIKSIYTSKTMSKELRLFRTSNIETEILMGNSFVPGTLKSEEFSYSDKRGVIMDNGTGLLYMYQSGTNTKLIPAPVGKVSYTDAVFTIKVPDGVMVDRVYNSFGTSLMKLTMTPRVPDVFSVMNNIIQVSSVKVTANDK